MISSRMIWSFFPLFNSLAEKPLLLYCTCQVFNTIIIRLLDKSMTRFSNSKPIDIRQNPSYYRIFQAPQDVHQHIRQ